MKYFKKFFWLCAGANKDLLEECPTEASKYVGIGATIFFTGIFAWLAGAYAMYTVFDNWIAAAALGLVWGLMIFNLDRYIVSSMRKSDDFWRDFRMATPRIILALIIAMVISKPLELKIFEKEINSELVLMEQQLYQSHEDQVRSRFTPTIEQANKEIKELNAEVAIQAAKRDTLRKIARVEADGTGGTLKRNAGPIYRIKKADADQAELELEDLQQRNSILVYEKLASIRNTDSLMNSEIAALDKNRYDGMAARLDALSNLSKKSFAIAMANWFIVLLFIAIETAPVFVKLISPRGPYDDLLQTEEYGFKVDRVEKMAQTNAKSKKRTSKLPEPEKNYITDQLEAGLES